MKIVFFLSLLIVGLPFIPSSFGWDGLMALDADQRNIELGEKINYQGYLYREEPISDELVYVTVFEQESGKTILEFNLTPESTTVDYFENTAWPFSFEVDTAQGFDDGEEYVVIANYDDKSTKLNFLIIESEFAELEEKADEAGEAIADAGTETGELILEAGKEAGEVIVDAGDKIIEKGAEVEEQVNQKRVEVKETVEEKGSEVISGIEDVAGGGCLIATATYGSELSPQVQQLRELRDNNLLQTESGAWFISGFNQFYYSFSPTIADYERQNPVFKEIVKLGISPMISSLSILNHVNLGSEAEVIGYGISLILLNVGIYAGAPVAIIFGIRKSIR